MEFTTYQTTHATSTIFEICERAQTAALVGSLKSTQLPIVYRITRAGRIPLFHSVRISYQQGRGRSTIAHREKISVPNSVVASLDIWRYYPFIWVSARYIVDVSPSFFFSPRRRFANRHGKRMQTLTPLCGVPPAVGVTSGGGAERRKPIVASTRPNHLRFCGQAIHVPSSFSWYSLTAHRDRDEPGYRLLLPRNPRHRIYETFINSESKREIFLEVS